MLNKIVFKSHIIDVEIPCDVCKKYKAAKRFKIESKLPSMMTLLNVKHISSYYTNEQHVYSIRLCSEECLEYVKLILC